MTNKTNIDQSYKNSGRYGITEDEFRTLSSDEKQNWERISVGDIVEKYDNMIGLGKHNTSEEAKKIHEKFIEYASYSLMHGERVDLTIGNLEKYIYSLFNFIVENCYAKLICNKSIFNERKAYILEKTGLEMNTKRSFINAWCADLLNNFSKESLCCYFD